MEVNLVSLSEDFSKAGIYRIWFSGASLNPKGGRKYYIGLAKNIRVRIGMHLSCLRRGKHWNNKVQNVYDKHGESTMMVEIMEVCPPDLEILSEREIFYIALLETINNDYGYNLRKGGVENIPNEEVCLKISKAQMGNKYNLGKKKSKEAIERQKQTRRENGKVLPPWTEERKQQAKARNFHHDEETKKVISEASKKAWETRDRTVSEEERDRLRNLQLGRTASEETKQKQSESQKKVVHTAEWNAKVAASLTGKKQTPEHTENVRRANTGKKQSAEARENMRLAGLKRVERERQEKLTGIKIERDKPPAKKYNRSPDRSGIYKVTFEGSDYSFIDSYPKLTYKRNFILRRLRANENTNKEMQRLYDQLGDASFTFTVLEYCNPEEFHGKIVKYK